VSAYRFSLEHGMSVRRFGSGPEIVWIHGLGEWSVSFDVVAQHRTLSGFSHTLPDLPGYGRSPWPDAPRDAGSDSLDDLANRLVGWLKEREPAVLVGHSMGGALATLVAERTPVRGVVDVDGNISGGDCTYSGKAASYTAEAFAAHGFTALRDEVYADSVSSPPLRGYHAALHLASADVFHRNGVDLVRLSLSETLAPRLAALSVPSLFVAGVPGGICERSRALLDHHGVRWVGVSPAGHWVYVDQPDAFAAAVASFVNELPRT
jgi:pimeloyl-ACP methyl ester carboxylesterase